MVVNNVFAFLKGECNDIEYLKYTHVGENKPGSVQKFNIFETYRDDINASFSKAVRKDGKKFKRKKKDSRIHYFYVIKRPGLYDSYAEKYTEYKIVNLDNKKGTVTCLHKERVYDSNPTCKEYWEENHSATSVRDKIDYYLDVTSDYE